MKTLQKFLPFLFVLVSIFVLSTILYDSLNQPEKRNGIELPGATLTNFHQVDEGVYRSDQPSNMDFKALETFGISEVLNLRRYHDDVDKTKETSLKLHHIRTHAHTLDEEQLVDALRIIKERKGPILVHCFHGSDRTGAVIALYRMVFQGVHVEKAIEDMCYGGYGYHKVYINLPKTLRKINVQEVRQKLGVQAVNVIE